MFCDAFADANARDSMSVIMCLGASDGHPIENNMNNLTFSLIPIVRNAERNKLIDFEFGRLT